MDLILKMEMAMRALYVIDDDYDNIVEEVLRGEGYSEEELDEFLKELRG